MNSLDDIPNIVPDSVRMILKTIRRAGFEAFIVGGCVRDILLGRVPGDWDITTSAHPEDIKKLFIATADTGLQHGTVMVLAGGSGYEVTTYRIDGEYKDGRHPESVTFTPSLEEDLKRRDFTINAFAYDPDEGIIDLFGGLKDLENGVIRAVGDPYKRFSEDALRIMRAVRFSAQLSFDIEEETKAAIASFSGKLAMVSRERIRVEFEKTLYSENPSYVNEYRELGLAQYIVPEYSDKCFSAGSVSLYDRLDNTGSSLHSEVLRLAAFFKDLTPSECSRAMRKMTFDNHRRDLTGGILEYADTLTADAGQGYIVLSDIQIRRGLCMMGPEILRLCLDFNAARGYDVSEAVRHLEEILTRGDAYSISMLDVTGSDLMAAGVPEGRKVGETLAELLSAVIEDPSLNNKENLITLAEGSAFK